MSVALVEAVARLREAVETYNRDKILSPLEAKLQKQMAVIFKKQKRAFLPEFAKLKSQFSEAVDPGQLKKIVDRVTARTSSEMQTTIQATGKDAYGSGIEGGSTLGHAISFTVDHPQAVQWLQNHAAEAVSQIDDTTRNVIGNLVTQGTEEGWSYSKTARMISDRFDEFAEGRPQEHIRSRAELVAVNETGTAYEQGHYDSIGSLVQQGLTMEKSWADMEDDRVCEDCQKNADAGWIPYDEDFPTGDQCAPHDPGCRCNTQYQVASGNETTQEEQ